MTQSSDPFEFFSGGGAAEICIADDIIRDGRLLPSNLKTHSLVYKRSESDGGITGGKLTAEYRKLRRAKSEAVGHQRAPPLPRARSVKPRWYWLPFWSARAPANMGIEEIKSRQRRRSSTAADVTEVNGVCGVESGKGAWRVIQSLSCKGSESAVDVSVTVPLRTLSRSGSVRGGGVFWEGKY